MDALLWDLEKDFVKGPRMTPRGRVNRRFWKLTPLNAETINKEKLQIKSNTTPHKLAIEYTKYKEYI